MIISILYDNITDHFSLCDYHNLETEICDQRISLLMRCDLKVFLPNHIVKLPIQAKTGV